MARPKPIGFDNYRTFSFVANDGSGFTFFRKASFSVEEGSMHRLYAGPSITSTNANANCTVTTDEAHGFVVGQTVVIHNVPGTSGVILNGPQVITAVPTTTTFQMGLDTSAAAATSAIGIVGIDIEARIPVANYAIVPGELCVGDHPEAWEMPLVG